MHDGRGEKQVPHTACLKLASHSGEHILDTFAIASVGERNQKSWNQIKKCLHSRSCGMNEAHQAAILGLIMRCKRDENLSVEYTQGSCTCFG